MTSTNSLTPICDDAAAYETLQWLLKGHDEKQIREALAQMCPGRDPSEIMRKVVDQLQQMGGADPDVIRGWAIEATRMIYQKQVEVGDYANAMKAIKQIMSLAPKAEDVHDQTYIANQSEAEETSKL